MRTKSLLIGVFALFCALAWVGRPAKGGQQDGMWDGARLRQALADLGYEPIALSEKKWEIKTTKQGYNIPVAGELSGSGNYVWLTVFLGQSPADEKAAKLLRQNFNIQPAQFYVTEKGNLMCAMPIDNRALTSAVLRKALDKLTDDVAKTSSDWEKQP